jgi:hypothetical protein
MIGSITKASRRSHEGPIADLTSTPRDLRMAVPRPDPLEGSCEGCAV